MKRRARTEFNIVVRVGKNQHRVGAQDRAGLDKR